MTGLDTLPPSTILPRPGAHKILVIDDDVHFCALVGAFARKLNLEVRTISTVLELSSMNELQTIEAAIIDYHLEGSDGFETASFIEQFYPELPIIIVSGEKFVQRKDWQWPPCVRKFCSKSQGVESILRAARDLLATPGTDPATLCKS